MRRKKILLLEDVEFEGDPRLSSNSNALYVTRFLKVDITPIWIYSKRKLFENLIEYSNALRPGDCIVLSFHGSPGRIYVGERSVTLRELRRVLRGRLKGVKLMFSSCETLRVMPFEVERFRVTLGLVEVAGYRSNLEMRTDNRIEREFLLNWLCD